MGVGVGERRVRNWVRDRRGGVGSGQRARGFTERAESGVVWGSKKGLKKARARVR